MDEADSGNGGGNRRLRPGESSTKKAGNSVKDGKKRMYRIAVVDDEAKYIRQIEEFLLRYFERDHTKFQVISFSNGLEFLNNYRASYDLILLDIEMPTMDGIEMAEKLRLIDSQVILIYMTKMAQYAAFGYDVDAIGFLVKPLTYYSFELKMKKAVCMLNERKSIRLIVTENRMKKVIVSDEILYMEALDHKVVFHTVNGEISCWGSLKEYAQKLQDAHFALSSRDYLVNLKYVRAVYEKELDVEGKCIPVSRDKKKQFMSKLTQFYGVI